MAANTHSDHDTLATFRRRFLKDVLFVQTLALAREMKLLKLGHIALDGTKIDANASKPKALSWAHAENSGRAAIPDGMDVPAEIARGEDRLRAIAQAKAKSLQRCGVEPLLVLKRESHHTPVLERFASDAPQPRRRARCCRWRTGWARRPGEPSTACASRRWNPSSSSSGG